MEGGETLTMRECTASMGGVSFQYHPAPQVRGNATNQTPEAKQLYHEGARYGVNVLEAREVPFVRCEACGRVALYPPLLARQSTSGDCGPYGMIADIQIHVSLGNELEAPHVSFLGGQHRTGVVNAVTNMQASAIVPHDELETC